MAQSQADLTAAASEKNLARRRLQRMREMAKEMNGRAQEIEQENKVRKATEVKVREILKGYWPPMSLSMSKQRGGGSGGGQRGCSNSDLKFLMETVLVKLMERAPA